MGSLHELLAKEGFNDRNFLRRQRKVKFRDRVDHESVTLPIYICHDSKSIDFSRHKVEKNYAGKSGSSSFSSKRGGSDSGKGKTRRADEPAIDEVATRAVISILSSYVGQYLRDKNFRESIRGKCYSCLLRKKQDSDNGNIFANMELGIESIERLAESPPGTKKEIKMKSLQNSIGFLTIVSSLNSKNSKNGSTCGTPNSHLSACAQLYLSIVYKLEKNDRISARHLLQVFCDSPFLARTHLLPDLWEHLFLPHLLHLKIWYTKQVEILSDSGVRDKQSKMTCLNKVYDDQMDLGTAQFALYYKEWLKTGAKPPPLPSVPLPSSTSCYAPPRRRKSSDSSNSHSSINNILYRAVFGPSVGHRRSTKSMDFDNGNGNTSHSWRSEEEEELCMDEYNKKHHKNVEHQTPKHRRSLSLSCAEPRVENQKSNHMRFLPCRGEETEFLVHSNALVKKIVNARVVNHSTDELKRAVTTICTSDSLRDCEMAVRVITKAWLDFPAVENTLLSQAPVIDGMMEILYVSNNDEILELIISLLSEFVARNEINAKIILNSDPQLNALMRLMRNSSLFLKTAALLYLLKPKAKQMISTEWIPLVLRVLEFGDQLQTLFTVRCTPQVAAYYFLDQLLTGFDEDRNWENGRLVVSVGGLSLLVRRTEIGDIVEKSKAAFILYCCIQADGRCRHYIANNLNMDSVVSLLVLGRDMRDYRESASALLTELLCLHRISERTMLLNGLKNGWGSLNTMHMLLINLQRARPEERPTIAAIMLLLDLMGDPLKCSAYREEAIEAIIAALDCKTCNENVQEQSAKALSILGGRFSYSGEPEAEKWLLKQAGFDESLDHRRSNAIVVDIGYKHLNEEDEETENWQRKAAIVLFGNKKLVAALSDGIVNGIPRLARASLVTVAWMSSFMIDSVPVHEGEGDVQSVPCSILMPQLIECLSYDKAVEERVLASFSLLGLAKSSGYGSKIWQMQKGLVLAHLHNLSQVTWTANKLTSILTGSSPIRS